MSVKNDTGTRTYILMIAMGIVIFAVYSSQSLDIPVRGDVTDVPLARSNDQDPAGNSNRMHHTTPVPPAMQKGFLR